MRTILFPQDFIKRELPEHRKVTQWAYIPTSLLLLAALSGAKMSLPPMISIISEPHFEEGMYELVDFRGEVGEIHPKMFTQEEINIYLINNPV